MSTADYSHIGQEFQPTEGARGDASQGRDAKAGDGPAVTLYKQMLAEAKLPPIAGLEATSGGRDGYFCRALSIYLAVRDKLTDDERESVLLMLKVESSRRSEQPFKEAGPGLVGFNPQ